MEFERSIFRVHERTLKSPKVQKVLTTAYKILLVTCKTIKA